jgi:hypothetical protein
MQPPPQHQWLLTSGLRDIFMTYILETLKAKIWWDKNKQKFVTDVFWYVKLKMNAVWTYIIVTSNFYYIYINYTKLYKII